MRASERASWAWCLRSVVFDKGACTASQAYRVHARRALAGGDDHIRGLDDRDDLAALAEAELLDGFDRDRGDKPLSRDVQHDIGDRRALVDALDRARQLIARAEFHETS